MANRTKVGSTFEIVTFCRNTIWSLFSAITQKGRSGTMSHIYCEALVLILAVRINAVLLIV